MQFILKSNTHRQLDPPICQTLVYRDSLALLLFPLETNTAIVVCDSLQQQNHNTAKMPPKAAPKSKQV